MRSNVDKSASLEAIYTDPLSIFLIFNATSFEGLFTTLEYVSEPLVGSITIPRSKKNISDKGVSWALDIPIAIRSIKPFRIRLNGFVAAPDRTYSYSSQSIT